MNQWDSWLDDGGAKCLPPTNQLDRWQPTYKAPAALFGKRGWNIWYYSKCVTAPCDVFVNKDHYRRSARGIWPKFDLFNSKMMHDLLSRECISTCSRFSNCQVFDTWVTFSDVTALFYLRAWHETGIYQLKQFNVLHSVFRHDIPHHGIAVAYVACFVTLMTPTSDPLFNVEL